MGVAAPYRRLGFGVDKNHVLSSPRVGYRCPSDTGEGQWVLAFYCIFPSPAG
jgi:hypothetical protein